MYTSPSRNYRRSHQKSKSRAQIYNCGNLQNSSCHEGSVFHNTARSNTSWFPLDRYEMLICGEATHTGLDHDQSLSAPCCRHWGISPARMACAPIGTSPEYSRITCWVHFANSSTTFRHLRGCGSVQPLKHGKPICNILCKITYSRFTASFKLQIQGRGNIW